MSKIAIDMDGVVFDLNGTLSIICALHNIPFVPYLAQHHFIDTAAEKFYGNEMKEIYLQILRTKRFFASIRPLYGAIDAVKWLMDRHDVFFLSAPMLGNEFCIEEKKESLQKHFGKEYADSAIFTHRKFTVDANYLIDDRWDIKDSGREPKDTNLPSWKHILYKHSYNSDYVHKADFVIDSWDDIYNFKF